MKYRKKPIVIDAFQWTGDSNQTEDPEWIVDAIKAGDVYLNMFEMKIKTLEGIMTASRYDFIIKGIQGEIYPCKPDIFNASYEEVVDE